MTPVCGNANVRVLDWGRSMYGIVVDRLLASLLFALRVLMLVGVATLLAQPTMAQRYCAKDARVSPAPDFGCPSGAVPLTGDSVVDCLLPNSPNSNWRLLATCIRDGGTLASRPDAASDPAQRERSTAASQPLSVQASDPLIMSIQTLLTSLGYQVGTLDGAMGPKTAFAIADFQRSVGEAPDAKPSEVLKARMQAALADQLEKARALGPRTIIGDWRIVRLRDKLTGRPLVVLSTKSVDTLPLAGGAEAQGELLLRCRDNSTAALAYFVNPIPSYQTTVSYRIDDKPIVTSIWRNGIATGVVGLFDSGSSIPFVKSLLGGAALVVRVQPRGSLETTLTFKLEGLREAIVPLRQTCEWDGPQKGLPLAVAEDSIDPSYLTGPQPIPPPPPRYRIRIP